MPDLFISYAREDRDTALAMAQAMQARGIDVWWDRALTGGGDFASEIERNLRASPLAMVLWSAASVLSDFVRDESSRARDMQKLLPVRISEVELPLGFGTLHTLDLLNWDGDPEDESFQSLLVQVRQRLAQAGPRDHSADEAARLANLARLAGEDTLGSRRRRRLVLLGGLAAAAGVAGLGGLGWLRFNHREALAHLGQGLDDQFASPPRLESAQNEYTAALELDDTLAPAHYFLAHLYAQLMLRGNPPPAGELLDAMRADARRHFQQALDNADQLDGAQRVAARNQLALLGQVDAAAPVSRAASDLALAEAGDGAGPDTPPVSAGQPDPAAGGSGAGGAGGTGGSRGEAPPPERVQARLPRVQAPAPVAQAARSRSEALFSPDRDSRLAATTSLTLDPTAAAEALPSAIAQARRALHNAPQADATRLGLASTLALLERASPASLREVQPALRGLLAELAASPLAATQADASARLSAALQRSFARRPVAYLQIARESQRPLAEALARRLTEAGYVTPGIELTGEARAPDKPSVHWKKPPAFLPSWWCCGAPSPPPTPTSCGLTKACAQQAAARGQAAAPDRGRAR
ncbi:MAG: TIR domain-containing protein [Burkholderiaceae bacterium]